MNYVFPEKTVTLLRKGLDKYQEEVKKPYPRADGIMQTMMKASYGFDECFESGHYAPYTHERDEYNIQGLNCTTVVPEMYIYCKELGLDPEIVKFVGMKEKGEFGKVEDTGSSSVHFALIIDVGRKRKYLFDPFWSKFGPIVRQGSKFVRFARNGSYDGARREFEEMLYLSEEEFAADMSHMHDPAGSLDMLAAGQKVYRGKNVAGVNTTLMVYYDPSSNTVSSRMEIPQQSIMGKFVYCNMPMSESGEVEEEALELYLAKDSKWIGLESGLKLANTKFEELEQLSRLMKKKDSRKVRIGKDMGSIDGELSDLVDRMMTRTDTNSVRKQILVRTLYEAADGSKDYLHSLRKREKRLRDVIQEEQKIAAQQRPIDRKLYYIGWKLTKVDKNEKRRLKYQQRRLKYKKSKVINEVDGLNYLRKDNSEIFHRRMDQVLFAKTLEKKSLGELEAMAAEQKLDPRMGYLAMVSDFVPYVMKGREHLTLGKFREQLKEKVKAKYSKTTSTVEQTPARSTEVQLAEAV